MGRRIGILAAADGAGAAAPCMHGITGLQQGGRPCTPWHTLPRCPQAWTRTKSRWRSTCSTSRQRSSCGLVCSSEQQQQQQQQAAAPVLRQMGATEECCSHVPAGRGACMSSCPQHHGVTRRGRACSACKLQLPTQR